MKRMFLRSFVPAGVCCLLATPGFPAEPAPAARPKINVHHDLRYRDGPSGQWRLDLAVPVATNGKPRPAIVVIHGGGWLEGDKSSFASRAHGVPGNIEDFAELGFVAATINYRLSGEAIFPAALDDCKCAVRWLRAHAKEYGVDTKHIGAYGNSAGGHLALMLAMTGEEAGSKGDMPYRSESGGVQAAVSDSGPLDLVYQYRHETLRQVVSQFMGGAPEGERAALYHKASPANLLKADTPPLLLLYGGADEQVPVETADRFVTESGRVGLKDVSYYRLAFVDHCPYSLIRVRGLIPVVNEFFLRTLMHPDSARQIQRRPD
jgi:acetyl esterase/lipase